MPPAPTQEEKVFPDGKIIVSKTDLKGRITYGNEIFIQLSGYSEHELIGKPHNIIRHPDMPAVVFKRLWQELQAGREIHAFVKNLSKDGSYYWVKANVTPSLDIRGNIIGYYSVRRKPRPSAINNITALYSQLKSLEQSGGISASEAFLTQTLTKNGVTYEEYILSL
jgi:PAS domain S-box-containing protein